MSFVRFNPSPPLTVGMELELQLLDRESLDLADGILPLLELYPDSAYVKPEFIQNTVEIASKVCRNAAEVEAHLSGVAAELRAHCERLGMRLCGAGTHPFCRRLALITPFPKYLKLEKLYGYFSHTQITYATHVHLGMTSGEEAIFLMRRLKPYLPLLIALSAASPFWRGYDSGFASYRHRILAASRSYGIPPSFETWRQFDDFFKAAFHARVFQTVHDIHWDIRPSPVLGTVEVRAMDAQPTIEEAAMFAALVHTLAAYLLQKGESVPASLPHALPWWLEKENHYQATRIGMAADYIFDASGEARPLKAVWGDLLPELLPVARRLGEERYLERLAGKAMEKGLSYMRQREAFEKTKSLRRVVASLADEFDQGIRNFKEVC